MRNLIELGVDVIGVDPDPARRAAVERALPVSTASCLEHALDDPATFAVIAAPTSLHAELAQEAADRGLALLIEKPLAHSWAGVPELISTIAERGLASLVACNLRFHPTLRRCRELLLDGAIGEPLAARIEFGYYLPAWHPTEDYRRNYSARSELGGGIVLDAIHELDYASWLLGEVREVACYARRVSSLNIETEDLAAILLDLGHVIVEIHLDYLQRAYSRTCQLIGSEGTIRWDYGTGEMRWYSAATESWHVEGLPPGWEPNLMYVAEMQHFVDCVAGLQTPALDAAGGAAVLRVAMAALQSAREGRFVRPHDVAQ
jgi:predicted dehydrogenase